MNKFVLSALALTTAGGLASAGTGSEEWLTLDREIESLASAQAATTASTSGVTLSGFIRTSYQNSSDIEFDDDSDLSGFSLDNARVNVTGTIGDYMLYVQLEGAGSSEEGFWVPGMLGLPSSGGSVGVLDAYGAWNVNDQFRLTMGQFRNPFLGASQRDENQLLFIDRSFMGTIWSQRDQGVMLSGQYDMLGWWLAALNGVDGAADELAFTARVAFDAMGTQQRVEGAYGASEGTNLAFSAAYTTDGSDGANGEDLSAWNVEGSLVMGVISAEAWYVDHEDGFADGTMWTEGPSVWGAQVGFMFVPDRWEVAGRYEDLDDDFDSSLWTLGLNYYAVGHDAKWSLNWAHNDSDAEDYDVIGLGLTVGV